MQTIRLLGAATAAALVAAVPLSMGSATAAEPVTGLGSGLVSATLLNVELGADGALLGLRVLGDDSRSTTDPANGKASSSNLLSPLTITSKLAPALNFAAPTVGTASEGEEDGERYEPQPFSSPAANGTVNAVLSSVVDTAGARSSLQAGLANLSLAGGLVSVPTGALQTATDAATSDAGAGRSVTVPEISVLELDAVLDGLGLDLLDLPVADVLGLLDGLGLDLPGLSDPTAVVAELNEALGALQGQTGPVSAELCTTLDGLLGSIGGIGGLPGLEDVVGTLPVPGVPTGTLPALPPAPALPGTGVLLDPIKSLNTGVVGLNAAALPADIDCSNLTATVEELLASVQDLLTGTLSGVLLALDGASLLSVKDINIDVVSKATDSVDTSVADVTATIGSVNIGGLKLAEGLDLAAPIADLNAVTDAVNAQIGSVLGILNGSLTDLVDVELLQINEVVSADGDVVKAIAEVVGVRATLTPPNLLGAAALLDVAAPVSDVITDLNGTLPVLSGVMGPLEAVLGGLEALSGLSTVTVASVAGTSEFRPLAAGEATPVVSPSGQLPRTGSDSAPVLAVGVVLAAAAVAIRRITRKAEVSPTA